MLNEIARNCIRIPFFSVQNNRAFSSVFCILVSALSTPQAQARTNFSVKRRIALITSIKQEGSPRPQNTRTGEPAEKLYQETETENGVVKKSTLSSLEFMELLTFSVVLLTDFHIVVSCANCEFIYVYNTCPNK